MKKPLLLFLFSIVSLAVQAVDIQDVVERPSGSKIVHIDVYIDQPNVEDCYETSVPDLYDSGIFKVYPNPNQGIFNLEIDYLYKGENIRIAIYDLTGKKNVFFQCARQRYSVHSRTESFNHPQRRLFHSGKSSSA